MHMKTTIRLRWLLMRGLALSLVILWVILQHPIRSTAPEVPKIVIAESAPTTVDHPADTGPLSESEEHPASAAQTSKQMNSSKIYEVVATGYHAGVECTGKLPEHPQYGITYSGVKVRRGTVSTIAADLNVFPIGTVLYIPDYGYGVVADIGGAVKGNVIDLYFPSREDVFREWGKRTVDVIVIQEGDGQLNEQRLHELETMYEGKAPPPSVL